MVTANRDLCVSPLRNIVMSSVMSSAEAPLRVKSPFSVSKLAAWPTPPLMSFKTQFCYYYYVVKTKYTYHFSISSKA